MLNFSMANRGADASSLGGLRPQVPRPPPPQPETAAEIRSGQGELLARREPGARVKIEEANARREAAAAAAEGSQQLHNEAGGVMPLLKAAAADADGDEGKGHMKLSHGSDS